MKKYVVVSIHDSSVSIEDCGITLPSRGSSAYITEHQYKYSKDIMRMKDMISLRWVGTTGIWPITNSVPVDDKPASPPPYHIAKRQSQDDMMDRLLSKLDRLTDVLSRIPDAPVRPISSSGSSTEKQKNPYHPEDDEPMFIPSSVVPKDAVAKINTTSDSSERSDIEDVSNLLKTLRAAKKRSQ
jgi:hypothetical protein